MVSRRRDIGFRHLCSKSSSTTFRRREFGHSSSPPRVTWLSRLSGLLKNSVALQEVDSEQILPNYKHKQVSGSKRKACSFKDDENFISSVPTNQHFEAGLSVRASSRGFESNRLEAVVLDLNADDSTGLKKQKSSYHWDKLLLSWSKKYVKLNNGERVTASGKIRTESCAKMKANKTGIYTRWKEQSHKKVSLKGTNDGSVEGASTSAGNPGVRGTGSKVKIISSPYQMLIFVQKSKLLSKLGKERQKKADRLPYLKGKPKKGKKKFGGREKGGKQNKLSRHWVSFSWF